MISETASLLLDLHVCDDSSVMFRFLLGFTIVITSIWPYLQKVSESSQPSDALMH